MDFSNVGSGAQASQILADYGADVVRLCEEGVFWSRDANFRSRIKLTVFHFRSGAASVPPKPAKRI